MNDLTRYVVKQDKTTKVTDYLNKLFMKVEIGTLGLIAATIALIYLCGVV